MPPQDTSQEKTEEPTQRKKRKAREKGKVPISSEVNNFAVLLAAVLVFYTFSDTLLRNIVTEMTTRLGDLAGPELTVRGAVRLGREAAIRAARCILPLGIGVAGAGLAASVAQTRGVVTFSRISPDLQKINPVEGVKKLFGGEALARVGVAIAKVAIIGIVIWTIIVPRMPWIRSVIGRGPTGTLKVGSRLSFLLLAWVVGGLLAVALADYAWQRYQHRKELMMTKKEVEEEKKQDEGRPEIEEKQEQRREEMAQSRMMEQVPEADVVVTNPTEIAVALRWESEDMDAPEVVAKGRRTVAERIKEIAREHGVPVVERKPLAQALEKAVDVGMEVPPHLYYAVAEVLSFVMQDGHSTEQGF